MKKIAIILYAICSLWTINSCSEDFLDVPLYGSFTPENLVSEEAVNKLLIACYSALGGEMDGNNTHLNSPHQIVISGVHSGELICTGGDRGTNLNLYQMNPGDARYLVNHWIWLYDAIDRCNKLIKHLDVVKDMSDPAKLQVIAEARFLRAHYFFYLKRTYNNVPWIDETSDDVRVPNTVNNDGVNYVNIWPQIAADMDFARKNLPETQTDLGRPNKWAADCYYAKIMIYRGNWGEYANGYSEALTILNDVMVNGVTSAGEKYGLLANYYHNFSAAHRNSPETVFAIQCSVNDGVTSMAGTQFGASPKGNLEMKPFGQTAPNAPGWGSGYAYASPSFWLAEHFRVNENGLPYLDMFETNPNPLKNDQGILSSEAFEPETAPLDPRLDWTLGRRGIPFLDYGINPGMNWTRGADTKGPYILKKFAVRNDEAGIFTVDKVNMATAINANIIRYADVLLLAAECNARLGNLDEARDLVNQVRNRMKQNSDSPDNWVKMNDGVTNAANYLVGLYPDDGSGDDAFTNIDDALEAILFERMLEFGTEGHRMWDVVRFGKDEEEFPAILAHHSKWLDWFKPGKYTRVPDAFCPIPRTAIDNSQKDGVPTLLQNPGY